MELYTKNKNKGGRITEWLIRLIGIDIPIHYQSYPISVISVRLSFINPLILFYFTLLEYY